MYIQPNGTIKLYHNVPLDTSYTNTLYFANRTEQNNYFHNYNSGILVRSFGGQTYTRVERGTIRVNATADEIYNCNYLAFQNGGFGNKWFYAFITGVEYINNVTSEIRFEIDEMQTWFLDVTLKESFVEREHSVGDTYLFHKGEENLAIGEYGYDTFKNTGLFDEWIILVLSPYDHKAQQSTVGSASNAHYNGVASGCYYNIITQENCIVYGAGGASTIYEGLYEWLRAMERNNHGDSVVSISMIPKKLCNVVTWDRSITQLPNSSINNFNLREFSVTRPYLGDLIGDYRPRNNKLFTYPYSFLGVLNGNGDMAEYRWEYFKLGQAITLGIKPDHITGTYTLFPRDYNTQNTDVQEETHFNPAESLTMSGVPLCSYTNDAYTIWFSQNKVSNLIQGLGTWASIGAGLSAGNPLMTIGGVYSAASMIGNFSKQKAVPDYTKGGGGGSSTYFGAGFQDFMYTNVHVQPQVARQIDSFFTMYGYATHMVKVPNTHARERWTYTKTNDCAIIGKNAPADSVKKIADIFNKGITFWKNASEVGNYSLQNNPL